MLAGQIAVIDGGRVAAEGTPARLKQLVAAQRLDLLLADAAEFDRVAGHVGGRAVIADADRLTIAVATDGTAGHVRALLDELDPERSAVRSFSVHAATLDDVFLAVTGHAATRPEKETARV